MNKSKSNDNFYKYESTWLLRFTRRFHEGIAFLLLLYPPFYDVFNDRSRKHNFSRKIVQFTYGSFLGFCKFILSLDVFSLLLFTVFYFLIIVDLDLDQTSAAVSGSIIFLFLAIGSVISRQVRCISLLLPLRLGNHTGRSVLVGFIIVNLANGPFTNILNNLRECVRVIVCQMSTTFSLLKTKYDVLFKPLRQAVFQAQGRGNEDKRLLTLVDEVLVPLKNEIENDTEIREIKIENDEIDFKMNDTKRSNATEVRNQIFPSDDEATRLSKNYNKKLEYRCQSMMTKIFVKCRTLFAPAYQKCIDGIPSILESMCHYMSLQYLCNAYALFGSDEMCKSPDIVDPKMGKLYQKLQNKTQELEEGFTNTHFRYKLVDVPPDVVETVQNAYDASTQIITEFRYQKSAIELFMMIMMRVMTFSFLFIILGCNTYISKYLNDIEADNRFITLYFRRIDYRRHVQGKLTLLPYLKRNEKRELCDIYAFRLTEDDSNELIHSLITNTVLFLFSMLFLLVDHVLYTLLEDIRIYGQIKYTQVGHHDLEVYIQGTGFLASLLRSIVSSFSVKQRVKKVILNTECLPHPNTPGQYTFKIIGTFILLYLLALLNAWFLKRLNRYVCSIFFPKAEKKRIIHLYNKTLKKRIIFLNYRLDIVREETKKRKSDGINLHTALKYKQPKLFGWLGRFKSARRKCLICGNDEPKMGGEYHCVNVRCYAYYCQQCWNFVVKRKCIGCVGYKENESVTSSPVRII